MCVPSRGRGGGAPACFHLFIVCCFCRFRPQQPPQGAGVSLGKLVPVSFCSRLPSPPAPRSFPSLVLHSATCLCPPVLHWLQGERGAVPCALRALVVTACGGGDRDVGETRTYTCKNRGPPMGQAGRATRQTDTSLRPRRAEVGSWGTLGGPLRTAVVYQPAWQHSNCLPRLLLWWLVAAESTCEHTCGAGREWGGVSQTQMSVRRLTPYLQSPLGALRIRALTVPCTREDGPSESGAQCTCPKQALSSSWQGTLQALWPQRGRKECLCPTREQCFWRPS